MITVRVPPRLAPSGREVLLIGDEVRSIGELVEALERHVAGFRAQYLAGGFSFAVNDELVLHGAWDRPLQPGDTVDVVPSIAGGAAGGRPQSVGRSLAT